MQPVYSKGEFGIQQYHKIKPGKQTETCWVIPYLYLCLQHALNTTPRGIFIQQSTQAAVRLPALCTTASPRVTALPHMLGTAILNMCIKSRKHPSYCACADELLHAARALSARRSRPAAQEAAASSFCTTCFPARGKERLAQTFGEHQQRPHAARPQAAVTSAGARLPAGSCPRYGAAATDPECLAPALLLVLSWGTVRGPPAAR